MFPSAPPRAAILAAVLLAPVVARAAPQYVDRGLTLPRHDWSLGFGLGLAHAPVPNTTLTGVGLNGEFAVGLTDDFQLGVRTGARFNGEGRVLRPDQAGRLFDTETFGTGTDRFANPELDLRWRFVDAQVVELGLDTRVYLPFETGTRVGAMVGMPLAFHFGRVVRLDTGINIPLLFYNPTVLVVSVPLRVWIQPDPRLYLGPISAFRYENDRGTTGFLLGFGLGYTVARPVDLKFQALFPRITDTAGARNVSLGLGLEIRIE